MRARGPDGNKTLGVEDMIDRFGVNKGSYEEVMLPKVRAYQANVTGPNAIEMGSEAIPASLEWGEVLGQRGAGRQSIPRISTPRISWLDRNFPSSPDRTV